MTKTVIVKVQIALFSGKPDMLIYDKNHSLMFKSQATDEVMELMAGDYKQFFYAQLSEGNLVLKGVAPQQEW